MEIKYKSKLLILNQAIYFFFQQITSLNQTKFIPNLKKQIHLEESLITQN